MNGISSVDQTRSVSISPSAKGKIDVTEKMPSAERVVKEEKFDQADLKAAVTRINDKLKMQNLSIQFAQDPDSGKTIFKVVDDQNNLIRQVPSPEMIEIAKSMERVQGSMQGLLVSQTA